MKRIALILCVSTLLLLWTFQAALSSYSLSDLAGTWYLKSLFTQQNGYPDDFGYDTGIFLLQSDGTFSGTFTDDGGSSWQDAGTFSVNSQGVVSFTSTGESEPSLTAVLNAGKDVMAANVKTSSEFILDVFVKKTSSYSLSDLAGTWCLKSLFTQQNGCPDDFGYDTGIFLLQSDGTFSGTFTDDGGSSWQDAGTFSVNSQGAVSFTSTGESEPSLTAVLNAGKDVMVANVKTSSEFILDVFVKKADEGNINNKPSVNTTPAINLLLFAD